MREIWVKIKTEKVKRYFFLNKKKDQKDYYQKIRKLHLQCIEVIEV